MATAGETQLDTSFLKNVNVTLESARGVDVTGQASQAGNEALGSFTLGNTKGEHTGLTTVKVAGAGVAVIDANHVAGSTLTTIDVSGMTAFLNLNDKGQQVTGNTANSIDYGYQNLSTTQITGNDTVAETIKLGGALDTVITGSTADKMDTIQGFSLVASASDAKVLDLTKSDVIKVAGATAVNGNDFVKVTIDAGNSTLALALDQVAKSTTVNQAVFTFDGNTYIFVDHGGNNGAANNVYDANSDTLIKLAGTYDLDLLAQAVVAETV